jgi:hypothetical protein
MDETNDAYVTHLIEYFEAMKDTGVHPGKQIDPIPRVGWHAVHIIMHAAHWQLLPALEHFESRG